MFSSSVENSRLAVGVGGEGREVEEKVDVIEGKEEEDEGDVEERDVDEEEGGKTMGREFGGLESHSEELPSAPNCSSGRMLAAGSCELIRGARGEPYESSSTGDGCEGRKEFPSTFSGFHFEYVGWGKLKVCWLLVLVLLGPDDADG